jgi:hypothetical protein
MELEKEYLTANQVIEWFLNNGVKCHRRTLARWISSYRGPQFTWGNNGEMWYRAKDLPEWVNTYNERLAKKIISTQGRKKVYVWLSYGDYNVVKNQAKKEKSTMTRMIKRVIDKYLDLEPSCTDNNPDIPKKKLGRPKKEVVDTTATKPSSPAIPDQDEAELLTGGFIIDRPLLRRINKAALKVKLTPNEALTTALNYWLVDVEDA